MSRGATGTGSSMLLEEIRDVFDHAGPFLTIEADAGRPDEHGLDQVDASWTTLRHQLEDLELPDGLVDEVHRRVSADPPMPGGLRRTLVIADDDVVFDGVRPEAGREPVTTEVAPLPDLGAWVRSHDAEIPFLLVRADHTGAEIDLFRAQSRPAGRRSFTGESFRVTKVPGDDWAQAQYQRRAEGLWESNAVEVAYLMTSLVRRTRPRVVLVCGDVRAVEMIESAWPTELAPLVELSAGGRAARTSQAALDEEIAVVLAEFAAHADADLADQIAAGAAHDRTAVGLAEVVDAFVQGRVETVALDPPTAAEITVRPDAHPGLDLPAEALHSAELPADRVLTALAARTGAAERVVDPALLPREGPAAVLRWSERV